MVSINLLNLLVNPEIAGITSTQGEISPPELGPDRQPTSDQNTSTSRSQTAASQGVAQGHSTSTKTTKSSTIIPISRSTSLNVAGSYVSLLSNNPGMTVERPEDDLEINQHQSVNRNDQSAVWNHAMALATSGNATEAAKFFKIHEDLAVSKKRGVETINTEPPRITTVIPLSDTATSKAIGEAFSEGGITFIPGAITSHMDIGFTPYFDKNLRELKGPIPLTIFNRQWQDLANGYHVEKRVRIENLSKDITTYTGYPYPHEMTQSYSARNMIVTTSFEADG